MPSAYHSLKSYEVLQNIPCFLYRVTEAQEFTEGLPLGEAAGEDIGYGPGWVGTVHRSHPTTKDHQGLQMRKEKKQHP